MTFNNIHMIVPLYNRGDDFVKLLENLKYVFCKIWVCDFGSTDIDITKEDSFPRKFNVISLKETFNWAKGIETVVRSQELAQCENAIIVMLDADTVFDDPIKTLAEIKAQVIRNKTFYAPNVATEGRPNPNKNPIWKTEFNGRHWVPLDTIPMRERRGFGFCAVYRSDYVLSGGFQGSDFMGERGEYWGQADTFIMQKLQMSQLTPIRPILSNVWLRLNNRDRKEHWYSKLDPRPCYIAN
jgi:hypothetical protein